MIGCGVAGYVEWWLYVGPGVTPVSTCSGCDGWGFGFYEAGSLNMYVRRWRDVCGSSSLLLARSQLVGGKDRTPAGAAGGDSEQMAQTCMDSWWCWRNQDKYGTLCRQYNELKMNILRNLTMYLSTEYI